MKNSKRYFSLLMVSFGLSMGNVTHAGGIPVIDVGAIAQAALQVQAWSEQYKQMAQQIAAMSGSRGMGNLVNNSGSRQYLPADYQTILSNGVGQWQAIYNASKKFDISSSSLSPNSDAAKSFGQVAKQAAINRAAAEEGYNTSSQRFADIQVLLDKVNSAPDAKDIADLQARIQAEQVMMQNEANKLQMLQQLASAQRDLAMQQAAEQRMNATRGTMPTW